MPKLNIQPIAYQGKRLNEVGDRIVSVFYPIVDDYNINDELGISDLDSLLLVNGKTGPYQKPRIVGPKVNHFLSEYGHPTLGVTSIDVTRTENDGWLFGKGNAVYNTAFVSTSRPEFDPLDSDIHVERLIIESQHELGHAFGLRAQHNSRRTLNGKLCPMEESQARKAWLGIITWGEYISQRDPHAFCEECYSHLGLIEITWTDDTDPAHS